MRCEESVERENQNHWGNPYAVHSPLYPSRYSFFDSFLPVDFQRTSFFLNTPCILLSLFSSSRIIFDQRLNGDEKWLGIHGRLVYASLPHFTSSPYLASHISVHRCFLPLHQKVLVPSPHFTCFTLDTVESPGHVLILWLTSCYHDE